MSNRRPFIRQSAAVLLACGLIAGLLPGFAAADNAWGPGYGGPGYTVTSNGLQIDGIQPNTPRNRVILDNDMFHEDPGWLILSAMHKLGRVDLRGIIVTHEPNPQRHLDGGIKPFSTQVDDFNKMRQLALDSGLWMMTHTEGARTMLVRPESGNIDDTQYTSTPGSRLIIQQAEASTPDNPLLVFVGGQFTTVATALLEKPSIANRMIVIYAASFPRSYNTYDSWAAYVTVLRAPLVDLAQEPWNDVRHAGGLEPGVFDAWPNNAVRRYIEPKYYRSDWMAYCDSPAIIWLFDQSLITGANGRDVTGLSLNVPTPWPTDGNETINSQQVSTSSYGYLDIRRSDRRAHEIMRSWTALLADPRVWDPNYTHTTPPPTESGTLGLENASGTRQQGNSLDATRFVAGSSFSADTMHARFTDNTASGVMRMAIYVDNDGNPGAVLGDTAQFDVGPGLRSAALKTPVEITEGNVYWIATWVQRDSTTNVTFVANDGAGTRYRAEPAYSATASFPGGSSLSHSANVTYAVYAAAQDLSAQEAPGARAEAIVPLDGPVLAGKPVTFKLSGNPSNPHWDLGDGATAQGSSVTHTYQKPGIHRVVMGSKVGETFNELSSAIVRVHTPETVHLPQVLLDTDARNEQDDQHYIAYALFSQLDVLGINSVHHNKWADETETQLVPAHSHWRGGLESETWNYDEIIKVLDLAKRSGLPCCTGANGISRSYEAFENSVQQEMV